MAEEKNICRVQKDKNNPYVILNKEFLDNPNLSWKAKGLLSYLLSKPDNWTVILSYLYGQSPNGEKAVRSGFNELKKYNHVMKYPVYQNGRICYWETVVFETPFTEDQRIKSKKILENNEEISLLAQNGKVGNSLLACFVQVEKLQVENAGLLSNDITNNDLLLNNEYDKKNKRKKQTKQEQVDKWEPFYL